MTNHNVGERKVRTGKNAPNYKKVVGKSRVHQWMRDKYGTPKICDTKNCQSASIWFDWALIHGKKYERKRANFKRLCRTCHRRYDFDQKKKDNAIKNLWWNKGKKNPGADNLWFHKDKGRTALLRSKRGNFSKK